MTTYEGSTPVPNEKSNSKYKVFTDLHKRMFLCKEQDPVWVILSKDR